MRYPRRILLVSLLLPFLGLASPLSAQLALGNKLVFDTALGENEEIFMAEQLDGRIKLTNLTNHPAMDTFPVWSPDGTRIAFVSTREGKNGALFAMDADGNNPVRLTRGDAFWPLSWSPSGHEIAFSKSDGFVYIIDDQGGNERKLVQGIMPSWSPSGDKIAYCRNMNRAFNDIDIFVIPVDGGEVVPLTNSLGIRDWFPSWSPDGSQLAFVSEQRKTQDMRIYIMDADGSNQRKLTDVDTLMETAPCWSLDGHWIAFFRGQDLRIIHPDGEGERKLLSGPSFHVISQISWFDPELDLGFARTIEPEGKAATTWGEVKKK